MALASPSSSRSRSLGAGLAVVVAVLIGSVAVAPSAWAGHSDVTASVECVDGEHILDWSWTAFRHTSTEVLPGVVAVEYTEGGAAEIVRTTSLVDVPHLTTGSTTLAPPAGATQVRVHVYAYWPETTNLIDWLDARTGWLTLPAPCEVDQAVEETTTTTVEETTTTTAAGGVAGVSSTTVTTSPPAAVAGVSVQRPAPAPASAASAQVQTQAAPTQTLPDTGSSSGIISAGAVMMIAIGGALVAASRRSLHAITVSSSDTPERR